MSDNLFALSTSMNFISPKEVSNGQRAVASVERWVLVRDLATGRCTHQWLSPGTGYKTREKVPVPMKYSEMRVST